MRTTTTNCLILAAAALASLSAPAFAQSVRDGIAAWQKNDYSGAVAIWRPLAAAGDADAAFNLAQAYRLGKGVPLNLSSSQSWYERAARKGHVDASTSLGILLFQNGDRQKAMVWLRQAAEAGEPRALLLFGTALFNGDGVPVDPVLAYAYVSRAAAQGLAPAKATLADMDAMIPLDQRQRGLAIAQARAKKETKAPQRPEAPVRTATAVPDKKSPVSAPASANPVARGGAWRIQLGAFAKKSSAESLFRSLSGSLAGRQPYYGAAGAVTRLQVGPFATKAEASATCAKLSAKGQACFAVPAR
jgi:hypothetical protein